MSDTAYLSDVSEGIANSSPFASPVLPLDPGSAPDLLRARWVSRAMIAGSVLSTWLVPAGQRFIAQGYINPNILPRPFLAGAVARRDWPVHYEREPDFFRSCEGWHGEGTTASDAAAASTTVCGHRRGDPHGAARCPAGSRVATGLGGGGSADRSVGRRGVSRRGARPPTGEPPQRRHPVVGIAGGIGGWMREPRSPRRPFPPRPRRTPG